MATDCSGLEAALKALHEQQARAALDLAEEPKAAAALDEILGREQMLGEAISGYEAVVREYERAIASLESSIGSRKREYERGLIDLHTQHRSLNAERERTSDVVDSDRLDNNMRMVSLAIRQHEEGLRQLEHTLSTSRAELNSVKTQAAADVVSHKKQLAELQPQIENARQHQEAASEQAREGKRRLQELQGEITAKRKELDDCRKRNDEESAGAGSEDGAGAGGGSGNGWFPP
jgi:chromosome segregation ATPase